ncbi:Transcriptional regulator, LysR family [Cupriavidus basilensis]|uniref:Transcriptional regulator, LysR family n=1 Tax=Cupriavidus basilensis TaxID=68895 RepID=A0A0C4YB58_9BURK|nr:Transcriptional regulator, LysR family [Cupriavidus basilensis]
MGFGNIARGLVPNAAGELFAAFSKHSLQDIERVAGAIQALRGLRYAKSRTATRAGARRR